MAGARRKGSDGSVDAEAGSTTRVDGVGGLAGDPGEGIDSGGIDSGGIDDGDGVPRATAWVSLGFEVLVARLAAARPDGPAHDHDYDVVIVGSGYGAAVAAAELAGCREPDGRPTRVCVLERGREYLPGAFPSRMADLAGHVRFNTADSPRTRGVREGLFDVRVGPDACAVLASGVGGGSLINAGVMAWPAAAVWEDPRWPAALRRPRERGRLAGLARRTRQALGAGTAPAGAPVPAKTRLLQALARGRPSGVRPLAFRPAPVTIALDGRTASSAGTPLSPCIGCGDCATGCNHGAKESLDVNLLARARRAGVEIYAGATVLRIEPDDRDQAGEDRGNHDHDHGHGHGYGASDGGDGGGGGDGRHRGWRVHVAYTDAALRRRQGAPLVLRARRVVVAAGTFGSTELLMRSRAAGLRVSPRLGHRFSANGDLIAVAYATRHPAHCAGDETRDPHAPDPKGPVGPTITGMIDARGGAGGGRGVVLQDLAVPGPLRRLFEEACTTTAALHELAEPDSRPHVAGGRDPAAVDPGRIERSLALALIGRDPADGRLVPVRPRRRRSDDPDDDCAARDRDFEHDGAVRVRWPQLRSHPPFARHHRWLARRLARSGVGGRLLPNPMWRLLPEKIDYLVDGRTGPLLTVHPLGGCPMGDDAATGVVDDLGRVFDPAATVGDAAGGAISGAPGVHAGLVVLDGSIVPVSLGINPALTIATLAQRAARRLRRQWGLTRANAGICEETMPAAPAAAVSITPAAASRPMATAEPPIGPLPSRRPVFRVMAAPPAVRKTRVEVLERLSGTVPLDVGRGATVERFVELTLRFAPQALDELSGAHGSRTLQVGGEFEATGSTGRLRVFERDPRDARNDPHDARNDLLRRLDEPRDDAATLVASVSGRLHILAREPSRAAGRRLRALPAWLLNRGLRDTVLEIVDRAAGNARRASGPGDTMFARIRSAWDLASRAGEVRLLDYDLTIDRVLRDRGQAPAGGHPWDGQSIRGVKRLTYSRRANPWRQLMQVALTRYPQRPAQPARPPRLTLDMPFLARQGMPLFRIVEQHDQPGALADVAAFGLYLLRVLLHGHIWSFRAPDAPAPRTIERLPGAIAGRLPECEVHWGTVGKDARGRPVRIRLARYPSKPAGQRPVLLIHGYSTSGTTFAHPAVRPGLAEYLWAGGERDVWVIDLRTSAGLPTASQPWAFEEAARDIPIAVDRILAETRQKKLDVFAHCMGAVMTGMALLDEAGSKLPGRIRRLALSQVAPALAFSPANVFRAYAMRHLRRMLLGRDYRFRPKARAGLIDQLTDRLLATLPYPEAEFDLENPVWPPWRRTPWVGTRHRLDALYGRDFTLAHFPQPVLDRIDDLFGPLSTETVSQTIHFARYRTITDRAGVNRYMIPERLAERLPFEILSVHGAANGLADPVTPALFAKALEDADPDLGRRFEHRSFKKLGHQDSLIGTGAVEVFEAVRAFFDRP